MGLYDLLCKDFDTAMTHSVGHYEFLSDDLLMEEEGYDLRLFHCRCVVQDMTVGFTIDKKTKINLAGVKLIKDLNLESMPHPRPYMLQWYDRVLDITSHVKSEFFTWSILIRLCDVIPVPMVSCQLLLGQPWCEEQGVAKVPRTMKYCFHWRNTRYSIIPMEEKVFLADRARWKLWAKTHNDLHDLKKSSTRSSWSDSIIGDKCLNHLKHQAVKKIF